MIELHRANGILDLATVRQRKIFFIGAGSLGSMVIANLAYPWRQTVITDPETLGPENIERHILDDRWIENPKVDGMRDYLVHRGLDDKSIITVFGTDEKVLNSKTEADLVIVTVDDRNACDRINAWCIEHNIPVIFAGVYPLGSGGEVCVITNPRQVCYVCAQQFIGGNVYQGKQVDYDLETSKLIGRFGEVKSIPALRNPIMRVACAVTDFAIEILTQEKGGVETQIHIVANSWEEVLKFAPGTVPASLTQFVAEMPNLGLFRTMKLITKQDGYALSILRSGLSLRVPRWRRCPFHSGY